MVVVLSSDAQADLDALRRTGRGALADRAEELIQRLAANPAGHRIEGIQRSIEGFGGQGWGRTVRAGDDVAAVGWAIDGDELVVLRVRRRRQR